MRWSNTPEEQEYGTYDLEFNCLSFQLNCTNLKIYTDCANITLGVCVVGESQQQARLCKDYPVQKQLATSVIERYTYLADTRVADEEKLEEVIVLACVHDGDLGGGLWERYSWRMGEGR